MTPEEISAKVDLVLKPMREAGLDNMEQSAVLQGAMGVVGAAIAQKQLFDTLLRLSIPNDGGLN